MSPPPQDNPRFDVRLRFAPEFTPHGEPLVPALARALGIEEAIAELFARRAPLSVKRDLTNEDAERLRFALASLGADVEVVSAVGTSTPAPALSQSARPAPLPSTASVPPVAPPRTSSRPASRRPPALPFSISRAAVALGAFLVIGVVVVFAVRWLKRASDAQSLGNTALQDTVCRGHYCIKGGIGLAERSRGKHMLVVAWRSGCLEDDYRAFLQELAERGEIAVVGVGLAIPQINDLRAFGRLPEPAPHEWPPEGCAPRFDMLPPDQGNASDILAPPITYLVDPDGALMAVWRGGMSLEQRTRLTVWIEGRQ